MKTVLPLKIENVAHARGFLQSLYENGESYNPENSAHDVGWDHLANRPTHEECDMLNGLMAEMYNLPDSFGHFDPAAFLLVCDPDYCNRLFDDIADGSYVWYRKGHAYHLAEVQSVGVYYIEANFVEPFKIPGDKNLWKAVTISRDQFPQLLKTAEVHFPKSSDYADDLIRRNPVELHVSEVPRIGLDAVDPDGEKAAGESSDIGVFPKRDQLADQDFNNALMALGSELAAGGFKMPMVDWAYQRKNLLEVHSGSVKRFSDAFGFAGYCSIEVGGEISGRVINLFCCLPEEMRIMKRAFEEIAQYHSVAYQLLNASKDAARASLFPDGDTANVDSKPPHSPNNGE